MLGLLPDGWLFGWATGKWYCRSLLRPHAPELVSRVLPTVCHWGHAHRCLFRPANQMVSWQLKVMVGHYLAKQGPHVRLFWARAAPAVTSIPTTSAGTALPPQPGSPCLETRHNALRSPTCEVWSDEESLWEHAPAVLHLSHTRCRLPFPVYSIISAYFWKIQYLWSVSRTTALYDYIFNSHLSFLSSDTSTLHYNIGTLLCFKVTTEFLCILIMLLYGCQS